MSQYDYEYDPRTGYSYPPEYKGNPFPRVQMPMDEINQLVNECLQSEHLTPFVKSRLYCIQNLTRGR